MKRVLVALVLVAGAGMALGAAPLRQAIYLPPACQTVTFHSEPTLAPQRVCMNLGVKTRGDGTEYLFLTPGYDGAGIFRENGSLVWWVPRPANVSLDDDLTLVHLWGQPYLAVWAGGPKYVGQAGGGGRSYINNGTVLLYNQHYQQVGAITAGHPFAPDRIDMHEFRITPGGRALVGIYEPVRVKVHGHTVIVDEYVVQELSLVRSSSGIHTGRVLFQWDSLKHVPLSASHAPDPGANRVWDYFHGNAIDQDSDGNLLVSSRNTWGIYKISIRTGKTIWQVGAAGDHKLARPWCYQHDVSALGHDEYSVFDDGSTGYDCFTGRSGHPSRGLIFRVNPSTHPAGVSLVHAYTHHPSIWAEYLGSTQLLGNHDVVVGWGTVPEITQYGPTGKVVMDLSLSQDSFRGFAYPWVGQPADPPSVAGQLLSSGTKVWASWNGATQVVKWQVLGGASPVLLSPAGGPVHRTGFETAISLPQRYAYVAVRALGAGGQVLGTSKPVNTTGS